MSTTHKKPPKSRSVRAQPHDWALLLDIVSADSLKHPTLDFEEHYVHAIQKALEGRDPRPLFKLLESKRMLHPALAPALADVIRSQKDGAVGSGKLLTEHQDRMIRQYFDTFRKGARSPARKSSTLLRAHLAKLFAVSLDTIDQSLQRTKKRGK